MSWNQWQGQAAIPPIINQTPILNQLTNTNTPTLINSAPSVISPNIQQYTQEQWAQLQQQNWHQWAQWQQQYQQWHQQYGAEYQKSMNALAAQAQSLPLLGAVPPPLPVENKPPLPSDDPPPPPPPNNQGYNTINQNYQTIQSNIGKTNWQNPNLNQCNQNNSNKRSYDQSTNFNEPNKKQLIHPTSPFPNQQQKFPSLMNQTVLPSLIGQQQQQQQQQQLLSQSKQPILSQSQILQPLFQSQSAPPPPPLSSQYPSQKSKDNYDELSDAEKKFDKQFAEWEAQFNKWKEQNSEHPDKEQYKEYEKKWEQWRTQLLERREQMKRKRLDNQQKSRQQIKYTPTDNTQRINEPLKFMVSPSCSQTNRFNSECIDGNVESGNILPDYSTNGGRFNNIIQNQTFNKQTPDISKPPPNMNDEPLNFTNNDGIDFLKPPSIDSGAGIPGLDLVKSLDSKKSVRDDDVMFVENSPDNNRKRPDFDAISKGIDTILGDQKLLNILSIVKSQQQNSNNDNNNSNFITAISKIKDSKIMEKKLLIDQTNDHSNHSSGDFTQRETVNNFDDQTRSSFTHNQNDQFENISYKNNLQEHFSNFDDKNLNKLPQTMDYDDRRFSVDTNFKRFNNPDTDRYDRQTNLNSDKKDSQNYNQQRGDYDFFYTKSQSHDKYPMCSKENIDLYRENCENMPTRLLTDDILKPSTVIDYNHRTKKNDNLEILVEPIHMFDYRHKPISRIPLPQRPKWLVDILKFIPEFDPPVVRPYENLRRYQSVSQSSPLQPPPPPNLSVHNSNDNWCKNKNLWSSYTSRRNYNDRFYDRRYDDRRSDDYKFYTSCNNDDKIFDDWNVRNKSSSIHFDEEKYESYKSDDTIKKLNDNQHHGSENNCKINEKTDIIMSSNKSKNVTMIEDIISPPGRYSRAPRIVIILRGPPGSGKTFLAKLIKDKEVENGGSAPRILSLDDYFMVEHEKEIVEEGKKVKIKEMIYEYEAEMEENYRLSLIKSFKKTIIGGYFTFIIVDNVNDKVKYFGEMWSFAKQNGFQVYICQLDLDVQLCTKRNVHGRSEVDIEKCIANWEPTPSHHPTVDATNLLQSGSISEVEMEEVNSPESLPSIDNDDEDNLKIDNTDDINGNSDENDRNEDNNEKEDQVARSKWDNFDCSLDNLAKLDGVHKPLRPSRTMEEYLQMETEWTPTKPSKPGQKRVRWADLEEQKHQQKMRAIGFVVGQTNWDRMMDPSMGSSALTQTKYIERVKRY